MLWVNIVLPLISVIITFCAVSYLFRTDDEFVRRTNDAYDRCMEDDDEEDFYSVNEFLQEMEKW